MISLVGPFGSYLAFANPHSDELPRPLGRKNMTVQLAQGWGEFEPRLQVYGGSSGYSALANLELAHSTNTGGDRSALALAYEKSVDRPLDFESIDVAVIKVV